MHRIIHIILTGGGLAGAILLGFILYCFWKSRSIVKKKPIPLYFAELKSQPHYCPVGEISTYVKMLVVSLEDAKFFWHRGFDRKEIVRAFLSNIKNRQIRRGGSTITQQLAKNLYLSPKRSYSRKLTELFIALELEKQLNKEEILELYLNVIYYGAGICSIRDACRYYFQREPAEVSLNQAFSLATLLPSPDRYSPLVNPEQFERKKAISLRYLSACELVREEDLPLFREAAFDEDLDEGTEAYYRQVIGKKYHDISDWFIKRQLEKRAKT